MQVEFLWFQDCPNHEEACQLLREVLAETAAGQPFEDVDATDPALAEELRFPGSPTIRINGVDVEPGFQEPEDYTPGCRLYTTGGRMQGSPERQWIVDAVGLALSWEQA